MALLRIFVVLLSCGLMNCDISRPGRGIRILSRREINEISRIAEENMAEEIRKTMATEEEPRGPIFIEPTPPDLGVGKTPVTDEIEIIRRNISDSNTVECNITARYLWELCRPVLLRTCKEHYRNRCRAPPYRHQLFNRRLQRMFPISRPPKIPFFKPRPLIKWFEDQISNVANSTDIQFTVTITNNGHTRTFTNQNTGEHFSNMTEEFHRALNNLRRKYGNLFPDFPFPDYSENPRQSFTDWMQRFLGDNGEDGDSDDEEEGVTEMPAERVQVDRAEKARRFDPSISIPKRLPKRRRRIGYTRTKRTPSDRWRRYYGIPSRTRTPYNNRSPRIRMSNRRTHRLPPRPSLTTRREHSRYPIPQMPQRINPWQYGSTSHHVYTPHQMPRNWQEGIHSYLPPWMRDFGKPPNFFSDRGTNEYEEEEARAEEAVRAEERITCEKIEENPEVCLEITERTEKCENELEAVCPEYVEARRRINDQLNEVYSRQHHIATENEDDDSRYEKNEKYEWASLLNGRKKPIVIESIKISQRGSGDAMVTAKLFETVNVNLRVPGADFNTHSLGEAIGKLAFESYESLVRRHRGEP